MRLRLFRPQRKQGDTEAAHPVALLCARRERPRRRRAAEQRDERAAFHSIISSASNCNELGTSMPSSLAVCALMPLERPWIISSGSISVPAAAAYTAPASAAVRPNPIL